VAPAPKKDGLTLEARQAIQVLSGATTPQERRQTVDGLMPTDLRTGPELVKLLLSVARSEGEATDVRVACIRTLARCRMGTPEVLATLRGLKDDEVPSIRAEAVIGLARLQMAGSAGVAKVAIR
jgi:hypothetical protein